MNDLRLKNWLNRFAYGTDCLVDAKGEGELNVAIRNLRLLRDELDRETHRKLARKPRLVPDPWRETLK